MGLVGLGLREGLPAPRTETSPLVISTRPFQPSAIAGDQGRHRFCLGPAAVDPDCRCWRLVRAEEHGGELRPPLLLLLLFLLGELSTLQPLNPIV
jgi:hypothetical protein